MKGRSPHYSPLYSDRKGGVSRWKLISRWIRYRKFSVLLTVGLIIAFGYILFYGLPRKVRVFVSLEEETARKGITIKGKRFMLDGRPFRFLSGSIHYFRVPRPYWRDRLAKLKAAGLNTVDTYIAWNMHEEQRGHFDFSGNLDIVEFLTTAHELGLYVILRPGLYICAEWDWGGLPPWLLTDANMKVRSLQSGYSLAVEAFYTELFRLLAPHQYSRGGPIIAVQIENEYGAYENNKTVLLWLKELLRKVGVVEFLFTSDGPKDLERGYTPGVYASVNYNDKTDEALDALEKFQPGAPLMTGEFWPGWFDHWSEKHHTLPSDDLVQRLEPIFKRGGSVNFYMFHGGTNFGFMNGANTVFPDQKKQGYAKYQPTITSYDYDAPLNEYGGKTEKYEKLRELIAKYQTPEEKQTKPSVDPWATSRQPMSYGEFNVQGYLLLTDALETLQPLPIDLQRPIFVEKLQSEKAHQFYYGFVAYRTTITWENVKKITISGVVADRMLVILNGKTIGTILSELDHAPTKQEIDVTAALSALVASEQEAKKPSTGHDLILLVENMGRANYAKTPHKLDGQYKGFDGSVTLDNPDGQIPLITWKVYSIRFKTPAELRSLITSATAKSQWRPADQLTPVQQPAFYRVEFDVKAGDAEYPDDTFVLTKDWGKGVVYGNGVNLGRYWNIGPQQTLYLPGVWLKKDAKNELVIFELHKPAATIKLQAEPQLGPPCPLPCYD